MEKVAYYKYFFIPKLRSYTKDIIVLLETNYKFENINTSFKIVYYKLSYIFNCLKKLKCESFLKINIFIFLNLLVKKGNKKQMYFIIQNNNLRNSIIYKKFLISKKESAILFFVY
jgi:hypothetical protein